MKFTEIWVGAALLGVGAGFILILGSVLVLANVETVPASEEDVSTEVEISAAAFALATVNAAPQRSAPVADGDQGDLAGDPMIGMELFNTFQAAASFACSTCHFVDSENMLIGPGLLNVGIRSETRVEGVSSIDYLRASIVSPDDYIVDGFSADLMPENWAEIYTDEEIDHIIAYLLTLNG